MTRLATIVGAAGSSAVVALGLFEMLDTEAPARASSLVFLPMGLIGLTGLWRNGRRLALLAGAVPVLLVAAALAWPVWK